AFLGLFLYGEKRLSQWAHWGTGVAVFLGSWLSGFFIIATDAWMQHPVGYSLASNGAIQLDNIWAVLLNPWAFWQYLHNMIASVVTASFGMMGLGAFYLLQGRNAESARIFVRTGVVAGCIASVLMIFPTGDQQGKNIATYQAA